MNVVGNCKVLIVGAGISGLAAAASLIRGGIQDVVILEARDKIGGRISTVTIDGVAIEEGATWIHGKQGNPLHKIIEEENIQVTEWDYLEKKKAADWLTDICTLTKNDVTMIIQACRDHHTFIDNLYLHHDNISNSKRLANHPCDLLSALNIRWRDFIAKEVLLRRRHLLESLQRTYVLSECADAGTYPLSDCPVSSFNEYIALEGGDVIVEGGYNQILNYFMKSIPASSIRCNCEVMKINWNEQSVSDRVEVIYKTGGTDTNIFRTDHVIVTVPLGCLKRDHGTFFNPELPIKKVEAIENIGFGKISKIALIYTKPFWSQEKQMIELLRQPQSLTSHWSDDLVEFIVRRSGNVHWLETWIPGEKAVQVEKSDPGEIARIITSVFKQFTGNHNIPLPTKVHVSKFTTSRFACGSYSYISHSCTGEDLDVLGQPLDGAGESSKLQLLFAGEATLRQYFGTAHAALLSGNREAIRLLNHYRETI